MGDVVKRWREVRLHDADSEINVRWREVGDALAARVEELETALRVVVETGTKVAGEPGYYARCVARDTLEKP